MKIAAVALLVAGGCEGASLDELLANKACTPEGECAAGYVCHPATNVCVPEGSSLDGGGGATSTSSGEGGEGGMGPCTSVTQCPMPQSDCEVPVCIGGVCGTTGLAMGTVAPVQTAGDCSVRICDGLGSVIDQNDDTDVPDDGEECTHDMCTSGLPDSLPELLGVPCSMNGGSFCDGLGLCVECNARSDCDMLPPDDECQQRACIDGQCMMEFTPANTQVALQTAGDCKSQVCNGSGAVTSIADTTDLPDDSNECTDDVCTSDVPSNPFELPGTPCMAGSCNAVGQCAGCTTADQCGASTFCAQRTCVGGLCGINYTTDGTPLPPASQISGDCSQLQCNGNGGTQAAASNFDVPGDDGFDCTDETCVNGAPQHPSLPLDTVCSSTGVVCDGAGACVECNNPSQCPNQGSVCQSAACGMDHICGLTNLPSGTAAPAGSQTDGDCQILVCDGSGSTTSTADDSDLPVDGDDCTLDVCNAGAPSHPFAPSGSPCANGGTCNGMGICSVNKPNGDPCTTGTECMSGFCAAGDGVCCNEACGGTCRSCLAFATGSPTGTCDDITSGQDPELECMPSNETCDGSGSCAFTCGQKPTPPPTPCPAACTGGCSAGKCFIDCNGNGACDLTTINCPSGFACEVQCSGNNGCGGAIINCPDYYSCRVVCQKGCNNADIHCGTGACSVQCGNPSGACSNTELYCGPNSCTATCTGSSEPNLVNAAAACSSQGC
jgi:hypothetical protein